MDVGRNSLLAYCAALRSRQIKWWAGAGFWRNTAVAYCALHALRAVKEELIHADDKVRFFCAILFAMTGSLFAQSHIEAPGPIGPLGGTMVVTNRVGGELVLIIPGSGPIDKDGNSPQGTKASIYRLLAEGLAKSGVSSVRIDKRGMFSSSAATADANAVTIADYADDIGAWVTAIRSRTGQKCVWLAGHSEGGLVALAATQHRADVCGLILLATPGRKLGDVLRTQLKANPANAPLLDQAFAAIVTLEAGQRVETAGMHAGLLRLFRKQVQGFLISALALDPADLLRRYKGPALIVQGQRDIQVGETDAEHLSRANPDAKLILLQNANHVFKDVNATARDANLAAYADPNLALAHGLVEAVAGFIAAHPAKDR
jgi:uncharacterized protein